METLINLRDDYLEENLFDEAIDVNQIINSVACHAQDIPFFAQDITTEQIVIVNKITTNNVEVFYPSPMRGLKSMTVNIERSRFDKEFELNIKVVE